MDTFVARQPIFDRTEKAFAYELLFRSGPENFFNGVDSDLASSSVISESMHVFGLQELTGGKKAFINTSRKVLLEGLMTLLPREVAVVELLETVEPDEDVIAACRTLKKSGYTLALDDFVFSPGYEALMPFVDIIKVDMLVTERAERESLVRRFGPRGIRFLAEKVETRAEFEDARRLGYTYFQGYFFCRPEMISKKEISAAKKSTLRLIQQINRRDLDLAAFENTIRQDAALTLKLLRYLNSAFFGLQSRIKTIKHALTMLGESSLRKWASLVALGALAKDKPGELVVTSLIRGRFCETTGARSHPLFQSDELFLMGMLSTFDALLDTPIGEILAEMSIAEELSAALTGKGGPLGPLFALVCSLERGEWDAAAGQGAEIRIDDAELARLYREAVIWADKVQAI